MRKSEELEKGCMAKALDHEMTFVLLARDEDAPDTIRDWIARKMKRGKRRPGDPKLVEAEECAKAMEREREGIRNEVLAALDAKEAEWNARAERIEKARAAIVAACGGPWKEGKPGVVGAIECPICGGILQYARAGYNGHVRACCKTDGCVTWME